MKLIACLLSVSLFAPFLLNAAVSPGDNGPPKGSNVSYLAVPLYFHPVQPAATEGSAAPSAQPRFAARGPGYNIVLTPGEAALYLASQSDSDHRPAAFPLPLGEGQGEGRPAGNLSIHESSDPLASLFSLFPPVEDPSSSVSARHGLGRGGSIPPAAFPVPLGEGQGEGRLVGSPSIHEFGDRSVSSFAQVSNYPTIQQSPVSSVLRLRFARGNPNPKIRGDSEQPAKVSYFSGSDPAKWQRGLPTFGKVIYEQVYPGIDVVFYGNQRRLEFDFIVAPGADPNQVRLEFEGADTVELDANGDLVLYLGEEEIRQHKPIAYQEINGARKEVEVKYNQISNHGSTRMNTDSNRSLVTLELGAYDRTIPLVIDPILSYATFLGGEVEDYANGVSIDSTGNIYVAGSTRPDDAHPDVFMPGAPLLGGSIRQATDSFVLKFSPGGSLVYAAIISGYENDAATAISTDAAGNAYITGHTWSKYNPGRNFPFQTAHTDGGSTAFIAKINPAGTELLYCVGLGGNQDEYPRDIAVDSAGNAIIVGLSFSQDYPTNNALFGRTSAVGIPDGFITKVNPRGELVFSTFFGGNRDDAIHSIALDSEGNLYITGTTLSDDFPITPGVIQSKRAGNWDAFVAKINPTGSQLIYSTYLGGDRDDYVDWVGKRIAVKGKGHAIVTGGTNSKDFPLRNAFKNKNLYGNNAFVSELNPEGTELVFSSYLGGWGNTFGTAIHLDARGHIYIAGHTGDNDMPSLDIVFGSRGNGDVFVSKLEAESYRVLSTVILGGVNGTEYTTGLAVDAFGNIALSGYLQFYNTERSNFPVTTNALQTVDKGGQWEGFVAKISPDPDTTPPYVVSAQTRGNRSGLYVEFSEAVTAATATNAANYSIDNGVTLSGPVVRLDTRRVLLTTSVLDPSLNYTLTVSGMQDFALPAQNTMSPQRIVVKQKPEMPAELGATVAGFQDDFNSPFLATNWIIGSDSIFNLNTNAISISDGSVKFNFDTSYSQSLGVNQPYDRSVQEILARVRIQTPGRLNYAAGFGLTKEPWNLNWNGPNYFFQDDGNVKYTWFNDNDYGLPGGQPRVEYRWKENEWYWVRFKHDPNFSPPGSNPGEFRIDAVDFNFNGGQHKPEASAMPYAGKAYQGLSARVGIDYFTSNGDGDDRYRIGETPNVGIQLFGASHNIGWIVQANWFNYTRNFPAGRYKVYAFMALNSGVGRARLEEVVSGSTTANQTVIPLGKFISESTSCCDAYRLIPLVDASGADVSIELTGERTLKFTAESGAAGNWNFNLAYLLLVPAPVELPFPAAFTGKVFRQDFNGGPTPPAGTSLRGNAAIDSTGGLTGGALKLTLAQNSQQGAFVINDFSEGALIGGFTAQFKVRMGGGTTPPADGFSFNFGSTMANPGSQDGTSLFWEEGAGNGLSVCFDTWDNGGGEAPAIDLKYGGSTLARVKVPREFLETRDLYVPVQINVDVDGTIDVGFNNAVIFTNTPGFKPVRSGIFALGARTGGANNNHWIDDLAIGTKLATDQAIVQSAFPIGADAPASAPVRIVLQDQGLVLSTSTVKVLFNGSDVTPSATVNKAGDQTTITFQPSSLSPSGYVNATRIEYGYSNSAVLSASEVSFVSGPLTLPTGLKKPNLFAKIWAADGFTPEPAVWDSWDNLSGHRQHSGLATITVGSAGNGGLFEVDYFLLKASGLSNITPSPSILPLGGVPGAVSISAVLPNQNVTEGQSVMFSVEERHISGTGPLKFQWLKNNSPIMGATNRVYVLASASLADNNGEFRLEVRNAFSSVASQPAILTVAPDTQPPAITSVLGFDQQLTINFSEPIAEATATNVANYSFPGSSLRIRLPSDPQPAPELTVTSGLKLWLKADAGISTNSEGRVIRWNDSSGNSNNAIAPGSDNAPGYSASAFNGKPALRFDGTNDVLEAASSASLVLTNSVTTFMVLNLERSGREHALWGKTLADGRARPLDFYISTRENLRARKEGSDGNAWENESYGFPIPMGEITVLGFDLNPDFIGVYLNHLTAPRTHIGGYSTAEEGLPLRIGSHANFGRALRGNLSEMLIFDRVLSDSERQTVIRYLKDKYGLTEQPAPVVLSNDRKSVTLQTTPQIAGTTYSVGLTGIKDASAAGNVFGTNANFTSQTLLRGFAQRELFTVLRDGSLSALKSLSKFPAEPVDVNFVGSLDGVRNYRELYGQRISGMVFPPVTGDYKFYLAADENAELYLSTDATPSNKRLIAKQGASPSPLGWQNLETGTVENPKGISLPIFLRSGQAYYVEALSAEGGGDDYLTVGWQLPGQPRLNGGEPVISAAYLGFVGNPEGKQLSVAIQPLENTISLRENERVTFSVTTTTSASIVLYQWQRNGLDIIGATNSNFTTPFLKVADSGSRFRCIVSIPGLSVPTEEKVVSVVNDSSPPTIVSVEGTSNRAGVIARFSEPVTPSSAENILNYSTTPDLTISAVKLVDLNTVALTTSTQANYTTYTITARNIQDSAGLIQLSSSASFRSWAASGNAIPGIKWEAYFNIDGASVDDLLRSPKFPDQPDEVLFPSVMDTRTFYNDNSHERYGGRFSGFFNAPTTGDYRFFLASDDGARVILNGQIIMDYGCCSGDFNTGRASALIPLAAGVHPIEALVKEGGGGDHLAVAVRMPGENYNDTAGLTALSGRFISTGGRIFSPEQLDIEIISQPQSVTKFENETAVFQVGVKNPAPYVRYQWQKNEIDIPGATNTTYLAGPVKIADDNARFRCLISNPFASAISATALLGVSLDLAAPRIESAANMNGQVLVCFDEFLKPDTAVDVRNYLVEGGLVNKVTLRPDGKSVLLNISGVVPLAVGRDDNGWPVGDGGGPDATFVQEIGTNPLPGNPANPEFDQQADDDYYFAGSYLTVLPGNGSYQPVGVVNRNEEAAERAFAGTDNILRYHFNLPGNLRSNDLLTVTFDALNLHPDGQSDPRYGIEIYFNNVLVQTQIVIRPPELDVDYTTAPFTLASVNARPGPGFDNILTLKGINYNSAGGGDWMGIDYVQISGASASHPLTAAYNLKISNVSDLSGNAIASSTAVAVSAPALKARDIPLSGVPNFGASLFQIDTTMPAQSSTEGLIVWNPQSNDGLPLVADMPWNGSGALKAGQWHRVTFAVDMSSAPPVISRYVDGLKQPETIPPAGLDGRFSLNPAAYLFTDNNYSTLKTYVNSIQIHGSKLTDEQIFALGSATAGGIPQLIQPAAQWDFEAQDLRPTIGAQPLELVGAGSASLPANTAPRPVKVSPANITLDEVLIFFTELLDGTSAETLSNYHFSDGSRVATQAKLDSSGAAVLLKLSPALTPGATNILNISAIKDRYGNAMAAHQIKISLENPTGKASSGLSVAGTLFIEAEDFNFGKGQWVTNKSIGMTGPYAGGDYALLGNGVDQSDCSGFDAGVDYHDGSRNNDSGASPAYRPGTAVEIAKRNGPAGFNRGAFDVSLNFTVGWTDTTEWMNYTRRFPEPAQNYKVYARMTHGGGPGNIRGGSLSRVTSDPSQCNQTVQELGLFRAPWTGGWDTWPDAGTSQDALIEMKNSAGDPVLLNLGGLQTLRWTFQANAGDLDYLMFVPPSYAIKSEITPVVQPASIPMEARANEARFGATSSFGIPAVNGINARVLEVPAFTPEMGLAMKHGINPNGGGTKVNQWTLVMDVLWRPQAFPTPNHTLTCAPGEYELKVGGYQMGQNIGGTDDSFHFAYEERNGDFDVKVQVESFDAPHSDSHMGLMVRESLNQRSRHYSAMVTPGNGSNYYDPLYRPSFSSGLDYSQTYRWPEYEPVGPVPYPNAWIRLKREGNRFTAFRSSDGLNWVVFGRHTAETPYPSRVYVGLAGASWNWNQGRFALAQFKNYGDFSETPLAITTQPESQEVCRDSTMGLSVVATGAGPLNYQWKFNGQDLADDDYYSGARLQTLTIRNAQLIHAGIYTVTVRNPGGPVNSSEASVHVVDLPSVRINNDATRIADEGDTVCFSLEVTGEPPLTYQWLFNNEPIPGETTDRLCIQNAKGTNTGAYSVLVANKCASVKSGAVNVIIRTNPKIEAAPLSRTNSLGGTEIFSVVASGTPPLTYQWFFQGAGQPSAAALDNSNTSSLTLAPLTTGHAGRYYVEVRNATPVVARSPDAFLTVTARPTIQTQPTNQIVARGSTVTIRVVASGTEPLAYVWQRNNSSSGFVNVSGGVNNSFLVITNVPFSESGIPFKVIISNSAGSLTSELATLTVIDPPSFSSQPGDVTRFLGESVTFNPGVAGGSPRSYQWFFNTTQALAGATSQSLVLTNLQRTNDGAYSLRVSNPVGVTNGRPIVLTVISPPNITNEPISQIKLVGDIVQFTVGAEGTQPFTHQWYSNGVQIANATNANLSLTNIQSNYAASYSVRVRNQAGFDDSVPAALTVYVPPSISAQPQDRTAARGDNVTLTVTASGTPTPEYQWRHNGFDLAGETRPTLLLNNIQTNQAGDYTVRAFTKAILDLPSSAGSVTSRVAKIVVNVPPEITRQPQPATVLEGQSTNFVVEATGTMSLNYQWRLNGTNIANAIEPILTLNAVSTNHAGDYSVVVTNIAGARTSVVARLTVHVSPRIVQQPLSQEAAAGSKVTFTVSAFGIPEPSYRWKYKATNANANTVDLGATGPTFQIAAVQKVEEGFYWAEVSNAAGSITSSNALLKVFLSNAPIARIERPLNNSEFLAPASVGIEASVTDDEAVAKVEIFNIAGNVTNLLLTTAEAPYRVTNVFSVGNYTLSARATDNRGYIGASPLVNIIVRPANDAFTNAIEFVTPTVNRITSGSTNGLNMNASKQIGERLHANTAGGRSVWWKWTAPVAGDVVLTTDGSTFDTLLAVYRGDSFETLAEVASNDDGGQGATTSTVRFSASAGVIYYIAVDGWGSETLVANTGQIRLALALNQPPSLVEIVNPGTLFVQGTAIGFNARAEDADDGIARVEFFLGGSRQGEDISEPYTFSPVNLEPGSYTVSARAFDRTGASISSTPVNFRVIHPQPANDNFGVVSLPLQVFKRTEKGTTAGATKQTGEPIHAGSEGSRSSVWWSWLSPAAGLVTINTIGSSNDTQLAVYTGSDVANLNQPPVAQDDDSGGNGAAQVAFETQAGQNYHIAVDSLPDLAGPISLNLELIVRPLVDITSPANNATFTTPAAILIQGRAQDADGINRVELTYNSTPLVTLTSFSSGAYSYTWSNNVPGNYVLQARAFDATGAFQTSSLVNITVQGAALAPVILAAPTNLPIAAGSIASFSVRAEGTPPLRLQWSFNGVAIAGATNASFVLANAQAQHEGNYTVEISNQAGSARSAPATLTVIQPPRITAQPQIQPSVAPGSQVSFTVVAGGSAPLRYQWLLNGVEISGATDPTLSINPVQPSHAGNYTVRVSNSAGSATSSETILTVESASAANEAPSLVREDFWITDGPVQAVVQTNGIIYLGGNFRYAGPNIGGGAVLDRQTAAPDRGYPRVHGDVHAVLSDGARGWFIGGSFPAVGGIARTNLARFRADKTVDPAWNPNANGIVRALAMRNGVIYAGGQFTRIGGQSRTNIAALDAATGEVLPWAPSVDGPIYAMEIAGDLIYIGGDFSRINELQTRKRIAALSLADGIATAWAPNANNSVFAIAISGDTVYAGGQFTSIGGKSRSRIAAIDALGNATDWDPDADNTVRAILLANNNVYAAGFFTTIGGESRLHLAALSPSTGDATEWRPNPNNAVWTLSIANGTVYAGGQFTEFATLNAQLATEIVPRLGLAAIDATSGAILPWNPSANDRVLALRVDENSVFAGGNFISLGGVVRNNLVALDAASGSATDWNPGADRPVRALAIAGQALYAGGEFTMLGGASRERLAAVGLADGQVIENWKPGANGTVNALAFSPSGSVLYAGGEFTTIAGASQNRLAALDPITGGLRNWNPNPNDNIYALAVNDSAVYAGGDFNTIGRANRNRVARLNLTTGDADAWNPSGADRLVQSLLLSGNTLYVGGLFTNIGGLARNHLAALQASSGDNLTWNPNVQHTNLPNRATVTALTLLGDRVYAGGFFNRSGAALRQGLVSIELAAGGALGAASSWNPQADGEVRSLAALGNAVYAGGNFTTVGGQSRPYFAAFVVPGLPIIFSQPRSQTVAVGQTNVVLSVVARGFEPLTYQWRLNGFIISGATAPEYVIPVAQSTHAGAYTVQITNAKGAVTSEPAQLTVLQPPAITSQPRDQTVQPGQNARFEVVASGALTYQWRLNGINIPGTTGSALLINNAQATNAGLYSVSVGNAAGSVNSSNAFLQVQVAPAQTLTDRFEDRANTSASSGIITGNNVGFTPQTDEPRHADKPGGRSAWFSWTAPANGIASFNTIGSSFDTLLAVYTGTNLASFNQNQNKIAADEDQGGFFASVVTFNAIAGVTYQIAVDGFGGAAGNIVLNWSFEETVEEVPRIARAPQDTSQLAGSKVTLSVAAEAAAPLSYQWFLDNQAIPGATQATYVINNLQRENVGLYSARVTALGGRRPVTTPAAVVEIADYDNRQQPPAFTEDKVRDIIPEQGAAAFTAYGRLKARNFASVSAGPLGSQILDNFGASKEPGEFNHAGVIGGASRWFRLQTETNGTLIVDTVGSDIDTVLAVYTGSSLLDLTLWASDDDGAPDGLRSMVRFPAQRENYLVVVDGKNGAVGNIKLNWRLGSTPVITLEPTNNFVNQAGAVTFRAAAAGTSLLQYQWRFNGVNIAGATNPVLTLNNVQTNQAGRYSLRVENPIGFATTRAAELTVTANRAPSLAVIQDQSTDEKQTLSFTVAATDPDNDGLTYSLERGAPTGAQINADTGLFTWTPSESQGPSTHTIAVRVTDKGNPPQSHTRSFTVLVREVNSAPRLLFEHALTTNELSLISVLAQAEDDDVPANKISFSLVSPPAGASIDPVTGLFTWTPSEAQGPNTHTIVVRVSDDGPGNPATTTNFVFTIREVNVAPVVPPIDDKRVSELSKLEFAVPATDADLPTNQLTFSLIGTVPAGASITPNTGVFTWTPTQAQGPATNSILVNVSDGQASVSQTFRVIVFETNSAPVLAQITQKTVAELAQLTFVAVATDADVPTNKLTFSLTGVVPTGATINPNTGLFTWTPTEAQGPATNDITVSVSDGIASVSQTFKVVVSEVNAAPILTAPPLQRATVGARFDLQLAATDADLPANVLTYALQAPLLAGATISPAGLFSWTPAASFANTTNVVTVRVLDNGTPPLSVTNIFSIAVTNLVDVTPKIKSITVLSGTVTLAWDTVASRNYRVQVKTRLNDPWTDLAGDIAGTGQPATKTESVGTNRTRFYRVVLLP